MNINDRYLISIEGNIGSGKTTLLKSLSEIYSYPIFFEPVNEWKFLNDYYQDQKKYAFIFQLEVLFSFIPSHQQKGLSFSERSTASGFLVFAQMLKEQEILATSAFDQLECIWTRYNVFPSLVIYLETNPAECFKRIQKRNRNCENKITLDYLQQLDVYHKKFLHYLTSKQIPIIVLNGEKNQKDLILDIQKKLSSYMSLGLTKSPKDKIEKNVELL